MCYDACAWSAVEWFWWMEGESTRPCKMEEGGWTSILSRRKVWPEWDRGLISRSASRWLVDTCDTWSFLEATKSRNDSQ